MFFKKNKKNKTAKTRLSEPKQLSLTKQQFNDLRALGVPSVLVDSFENYVGMNPKVKDFEVRAMKKEQAATQYMLKAQECIQNRELSTCLEFMYKARMETWEAIEIHKQSDRNHPAISLLEYGIKHIDGAIRNCEQSIDDNDFGDAIY